MTERIKKGGLEIATVLYNLVANEIAPGTGVEPDVFWAKFEEILTDLVPKNKALLAKRDAIQAQIDAWHQARAGKPVDMTESKAFLHQNGKLHVQPPLI